jgi:tetratricopeptide (TPR) repeat protein
VLHGLIGAAIEDLYADRLAEHYEKLANHFRAAEEWQKALDYHERAAEKATHAYANHSVAEHCRWGLAIADRLEAGVADAQRVRLEQMLAAACFCLSEYKRSGNAFARAADRSTDLEARAMNLGRAAYAYSWGHAYDRSEEMARRGRELSREHDLPAGEGIALFAEAWNSGMHGDVGTYESLAPEVLRLGERSGNEEVIAYARYAMAMHAEWTGNYVRAVELLPGVIEIGRRIQMPAFVVWGNWFLGKAYCCLGDYGRAHAQLEAGLELTDRIGDRAWRSRLLNTVGWYYAEIGSHERARQFNEQAVQIARELEDDEIIANAEINLGRNHLALGHLDVALGYLEPIWTGLERRDPWMRWRYSLHLIDALARIELARGDPQRALDLASDQLARAAPHQAPKIEARALELQAQALLALDRGEEAHKAATRGLETAEKIQHPSVRWHGLEVLAELARRRGDTSEAETRERQLHELLQSLARGIPESELRDGLLSMADHRRSRLSRDDSAGSWDI